MSYSTEIISTNPSHLYVFDGDTNDSVGTNNVTNNGGKLTYDAITEEATNSYGFNNTSDYGQVGDEAAIDNETDRIAYGGWFMVNKINQPPTRIIGSGASTCNVSVFLGFGNNVIFEADTDPNVNQIYSDIPLEPNRPYHILIKFSSNNYSNEIYGYIDGIKQTYTFDNTPDDTLVTNRHNLQFGGTDGVNGLSIGGTPLRLVTPIITSYNYWGVWLGVNSENLTDTQIREILFEKGALASNTLVSDTEANMQTALDALGNTTYPNQVLTLRIEANTGDTDFTLEATDFVFDDLTSIHIQYMGTATLTWVNKGTSNCSIVSTPNGGTVNIINLSKISFTGLVNPTEVRIYKHGTKEEVAGVEDVTTGTWEAVIPNGVYDIRIHSVTYKHIDFEGYNLESDQNITVKQFKDINYLNPYGIDVEYHILDKNGVSFNAVDGTYFRPNED